MGCNIHISAVSQPPFYCLHHFTPFFHLHRHALHILVPVLRVKGMQLIDDNSKNLRLLKVAKDIVFYFFCFVTEHL